MGQDEQTAKATLVQTKYTEMLLRIPHVMGVAVGLLKKGGVYTGQVGIVVMVDQKQPADSLAPQDLVPSQLDGVPVDVQEIGVPTAF